MLVTGFTDYELCETLYCTLIFLCVWETDVCVCVLGVCVCWGVFLGVSEVEENGEALQPCSQTCIKYIYTVHTHKTLCNILRCV